MPVNEVNNDVYTGEARSSSEGVNKTDQKTQNIAKDKITPPVPQETPPPASYFSLDFFYQLFWPAPAPSTSPKPPETPPKAPPSCDSLWSQRDLPRLLDLLETEMHTPQGITWRPKANLDQLPKLKSDSTYLNQFARDLTQEALEGKLSPFVGREKEIAQIAEILMRRQKNTPLLLGVPGVGKSAIVEGIAQMIVQNNENLPPVFKDKRIYLIQSKFLTDRTPKGDDPVEGLVELIQEARANKNQMILFIDDIHSFITSNILKQALADGSISCIAATTPLDYKKMLKNDPTLMSQFPTPYVREPLEKEVLAILKAFIPRFESRHGVRMGEEALEECLALSKRFINSEKFPQKALDLLDQAANLASVEKTIRVDEMLRHQQWAFFFDRLLLMRKEVDDPQIIDQKIEEIRTRFPQVTADHIRKVVSRKLDIPISTLLEPEKNFVDKLEKQISDVWEN
ncbi:MAG TPA: AAA family ATPase [Rhabdochlamydiaceae bacterium]|nr:AAA family ATPase [Rhabdochlamydiaceae bacterium]